MDFSQMLIGRRQAYTDVEGFLQLILKTENLTEEQRNCYTRVIRKVRTDAGIPQTD